MTGGAEQNPPDIWETPTAAEQMAKARKQSGLKAAWQRIRKWCPFGK